MKLKAMLVDDEIHLLRNLQTVLPWERLQIDVVALARNGEQALEEAERHRPDIVLSDIRMPLMDGIRLLEELRRRDIRSEVIMITGHQDFEYARSVLKHGARDYVLKPIDYEELERTVEELAAEIRSRRMKLVQEEKKGSRVFHAYKRPKRSLPLMPERNVDMAREAQREASGRKSGEQLMREARDYIERHLEDNFGIEELAARLGISYSYFSMLFKQHFAATFVEYVTARRMERAKSLLLNPDNSIAQIGKTVGIPERRYFTKVFQKRVGVSPSEYRGRHGVKSRMES
ncbi:response regulator transcription factor [Paenibacillus cymbidii]|uniref:response regulator transcription factor n=1 Tax=Paenibacillus cymbidii TaxID=1639034 RepID=UPI001081E98A|nr:response regulator [Paenibacillus cymbidii]